MRREKPTDGELEVLRLITDRAPVNAREIAEHLATERGLARTTVLTTIERLRKKGLIEREAAPGGFAYLPVQSKSKLLHGLVEEFVDRTLGGSLSPLVAYLSDRRQATPEEIAQLRRLVDEFEQGDGRR